MKEEYTAYKFAIMIKSKEVGAWIDRKVTRGLQVITSSPLTEKAPGVVVFNRRATPEEPNYSNRLRAIKTPDGKIIIGDKTARVHIEDSDGNLTARFKITRAPQEYTVLSSKQTKNLVDNPLSALTTEQILNLKPETVTNRMNRTQPLPLALGYDRWPGRPVGIS